MVEKYIKMFAKLRTDRGRGILDGKTQIGFYGTRQEILQQQREAEEGRSLSQRWVNRPLTTPQIQLDRLRKFGNDNMKKCKPEDPYRL